MKTWRTWTRKEEARLIDLRGRGMTAAQAAAEMGRTLSSVKNGLRVVDAPRHSPRRIDWLYALTAGLSERQVAERMNVTVWAVKRMKQRLPLSR